MPNDLPPAVTLALLAMLGAMGCILLLGPLVWYMVFRRLAHGQPILEHEPRNVATWGVLDFVVFIALWITSTWMLVGIAKQIWGWQPPQSDTEAMANLHLIFLGSLSQILAAAGTGLFILLRTRCSLRDLGVSLVDLQRDVRLGGAAFCALAIPTYGLQLILTQFWKSEHPLIESLKDSPGPEFLAIAVFAAVVSAPLTEEFMFRVLLQGWLEKIVDPEGLASDRLLASAFVGHRLGDSPAAAEPKELPVMAELVEPHEPSDPYLAEITPNPYFFPTGPEPSPHSPSSDTRGTSRRAGDLVPIVVSSAIFAGLHYSHGPDWIPLLFLAVGLGYLYRRTHRMTPGLVVHFLLNSVSMLGLCAEVYKDKLPQ